MEAKAENNEKEITIEEAFEQLETMIGQLENPETELLDAVNIYGNGVKLVRHCQELLDMAEKQIIVLEGDGNGEEL